MAAAEEHGNKEQVAAVAKNQPTDYRAAQRAHYALRLLPKPTRPIGTMPIVSAMAVIRTGRKG